MSALVIALKNYKKTKTKQSLIVDVNVLVLKK